MAPSADELPIPSGKPVAKAVIAIVRADEKVSSIKTQVQFNYY